MNTSPERLAALLPRSMTRALKNPLGSAEMGSAHEKDMENWPQQPKKDMNSSTRRNSVAERIQFFFLIGKVHRLNLGQIALW